MNRLFVAVCALFWLGLLAWAGSIIYFSSLSGPELQEVVTFEFWDKAAHFVAFAAGGVLAAGSIRGTTAWPWPRVILSSVVLLALFAGTDELHQTYTPGRTGGDWQDWVADVLGAWAGASLLPVVWRWKPAGIRREP